MTLQWVVRLTTRLPRQDFSETRARYPRSLPVAGLTEKTLIFVISRSSIFRRSRYLPSASPQRGAAEACPMDSLNGSVPSAS